MYFLLKWDCVNIINLLLLFSKLVPVEIRWKTRVIDCLVLNVKDSNICGKYKSSDNDYVKLSVKSVCDLTFQETLIRMCGFSYMTFDSLRNKHKFVQKVAKVSNFYIGLKKCTHLYIHTYIQTHTNLLDMFFLKNFIYLKNCTVT